MTNNAKIALLTTTAFFVGEAVGVARGNRHWKPLYDRLTRSHEVANQQVVALSDFISNTPSDPEGALKKFEEHSQFIDILNDNI